MGFEFRPEAVDFERPLARRPAARFSGVQLGVGRGSYFLDLSPKLPRTGRRILLQ